MKVTLNKAFLLLDWESDITLQLNKIKIPEYIQSSWTGLISELELGISDQFKLKLTSFCSISRYGWIEVTLNL